MRIEAYVKIAIASSFLTAAVPPMAGADSITTGPVDTAAFQEIVDAASPGDTIVAAGGTYDFAAGPVRLDKRLSIVAQDSAHPPVFTGRTDSAGNPLSGTRFEDGNNGFVVWGLSSDVHHIELLGLHFRDFDRAIAFAPSFVPSEDCRPTAGTLSHVRVAGGRFVNNASSVRFFGRGVSHFEVEDNAIVGSNLHTGNSVVVGGGSFGRCPLSGVDIGRPVHGRIARNTLTLPPNRGEGLVVLDGVSMTIDHNTIQGGNVGVEFGDAHASVFGDDDGPINLGSVTGNRISGSRFGIYAFGPTTIGKAKISDNSVDGALGIEVLLTEGANGFVVTDNEFPGGSPIADIYLDEAFLDLPAAHDNKVVIKDPAITVLDFGIDNKVIRK